MLKALVDMDGVLVNFMQGAHDFHQLVYDYDQNYPYPLGCWEFLDYTGLTPEEFWNPLQLDFWSGLDWMPDGKDILQRIEDFFGKENVCLLTSPCESYGCMEGKRAWIRQNLPDYGRRFLMGSAKYFLASENAVLFDDYDGNHDAFYKHGGHAVLIPRKWNRLHRYHGRTIHLLNEDLDIIKEAAETERMYR